MLVMKVCKYPNWITITCDGHFMWYSHYSKRQAISKFRHKFGLVGKHIELFLEV